MHAIRRLVGNVRHCLRSRAENEVQHIQADNDKFLWPSNELAAGAKRFHLQREETVCLVVVIENRVQRYCTCAWAREYLSAAALSMSSHEATHK